ncbi:hypothetical protein NDU88_008030, partial [Pleurodeles waltl]
QIVSIARVLLHPAAAELAPARLRADSEHCEDTAAPCGRQNWRRLDYEQIVSIA